MLRIGIVAGEPSGDNLGAALIASIKQRCPDVVVEGIGGEKLIAQGCHSLFDMERLSVMGLFEILGRYFELLSIQTKLKRHFVNNPPDIFIGIDAPDFNLSIEKHLKRHGIKTVHYVSPSVWAWREGRLKTIKESVDLMLTLFPFEEEYYLSNDIPVKFVGHPLAHEIPLNVDTEMARQRLQLDPDKQYVALLPGSRGAEITRLTEPFLKACAKCLQRMPNLVFIVGLRDQKACDLFSSIKDKVTPDLAVNIFTAKTRDVLVAADCVLLASGTATLETMLSKKPMVVAYKANWLTYKIIKPLLKIPHVSLPNIMAGEKLVPELLQEDCTDEKLSSELMKYLSDKQLNDELIAKFQALHQSLIETDADTAQQAVFELAERRCDGE